MKNLNFTKIAKRIFNFLQHCLYVDETLILFEHDRPVPQISPAVIAYITHENVSDVLDFQHSRYKSIFEDFLRRGDTGYFAYLDGKCVHRSWVVQQPRTVHLHPLLPRQLREGELFIHYCETAPEARGKSIYPAVLSRITEDFRNTGRRLMISVNVKNKSSIKGVVKAGFKERERERIIVLLGMKFKKRYKL